MAKTKGSGNGVHAEKAPVATKRQSTAVALPTDWDKELARYAQRSAKVAEVSAGGGSWITFKGGMLFYKGLEIPSKDTEVVVVAEVLENLYYKDKFDPDNAASPVCYALSPELDGMAPHETSPEPQHETCRGCPQNEWGSSDTGKGKACKNSVRLAMLPWGDGTVEQMEKAELAFSKLPVTSVKNWSSYVNSLTAKFGDRAPPFMFVTRLTVVPDQRSQFQVRFDLVEAIPKTHRAAVFARVKEAEAAIIPAVPYQPVEQKEKPKAKAKGHPAKGKAAPAPARRAKY